MTVTLALQKALRAAFVGATGVTALVPAANIVDRHLRPAPAPSVVLGEVTVGPVDGNVARTRVEVWADVHVWAAEESTEGARRIMAALRACIRPALRPVLDGGLHLAEWEVARERVMRDPAGDASHGVLTVRAVVGGLVA